MFYGAHVSLVEIVPNPNPNRNQLIQFFWYDTLLNFHKREMERYYE